MKWLVTTVLMALLISGCAHFDSIDYNTKPPKDWPDLTIRVHTVTKEQILQACNKVVPFPQACASINFYFKTCDVYVPEGAARDFFIRHELAHCNGYDHVGETALRDAWEVWKKENKKE